MHFVYVICMKNCFHQYGHQYCNHYHRKKNATEFKVCQFKCFCLNSITPCDIIEYCIAGPKIIYSNIKFFIFKLICILAKMVITFEPAGIFFMRFSMLYSGEQILSFKLCLLFYTVDSLSFH